VSFCSLEFLVFLPLVLAGYYSLRSLRGRNALLLVASYAFYGAWDWRFLFLLLGSTLLDFVTGAQIARTDVRWKRRCWLGLSIAGNIGSLVLFKYADFFILGFQQLMGSLGLRVEVTLLRLVLPVGISFYNFQTMTYSLDIYRGQLKPTRSFLDFALFVSFFPQLVAGPIVRAVELLPQLQRVAQASWDDVVTGVNRFAEGLAKKLLVADNLAPYVDRIFADPGAHDGATLWCASLGFAVQCYCDFAGYTDMAIGCGRLLGFWLPENFRWPFLATSVTDFWRRWHITLYAFMRDYLYLALGGSRVSPARRTFNAMLTMTLVGLWHGAAWNFVLWGAYNGVLVVGHRWLAAGLQRVRAVARALATPPGTLLRIAVTNLLFVVSFLLFRSRGTLADALESAWRMLTLDGAGRRELDPWVPLAFAAVLVGSLWQEKGLGPRLAQRLRGRVVCLPLQLAGYAALIWLLVLFAPHDTTAFVYFQF
jgi:alginate O-acetyltransferase complex protein AlgI